MSDQVLQNKAEISLDPSDFEGNARKINAALAQIAATSRQVNAGFQSINTSSSATTSRFSSLASQTQAMRAGMNSLGAALNTTSNGMASLRNRIGQLNAATQANTGATRANTASITALGTHITALQASVDQLSQHMARAATTTTQAGNAARNAAGGWGMLGQAVAALSFGIIAKEAVQLTDAYRSLQQRLTITTAGIASSAGAMADVSRIARETRAAIDDVGLLYAKVANAGKNFGATQTQVARVTETVSKGLRVFGASAAETSSTITQLGQALASGRLQGDEFRSMTENAPALMDILAKSTGKPRAELKKLGSEGKLTSDIIIKAFGDQSPAIAQLDRDFAKLPVTVSESMTLVKNSIEVALGTSDKMVGITKALSGGLQVLANNMTTILPIIGALSMAVGVGMVTNFVAARIAAGSLGASLLGAFGGGIGLLITGATIGLSALAVGSMDANRTIDMLADSTAKAGGNSRVTGVEALMAARGVASFGGAAGVAAGKLWDMASAARAAAIETAKLKLQKSSADFRTANSLTDRGFVRAQERDASVLNDSNASFGEQMGAIGSQLQRGWSKIWAPRQERVIAARNQAFTNMQEDFRSLQEAASAPMESYIPKIDPPVSSGKKDKKKGAKGDPIGDFWRNMEKDRDLAAATAFQEAQITKEFELQNAAHRKLNDAEKTRIASLLEQTRQAKLLKDMMERTQDLSVQNAADEASLWAKANGATDDQMNLEKALNEFRQRAVKERISTESELYRTREGEYRKELERANQLKSIQRGLDYAASQSPEMRNIRAGDELRNRRADLDAAYNAPNSTLTARDYKLGLRGIENDQRKLANEWYTSMGESISGVADLFGEKMGAKIDKLGKLMDAVVKAASGDMSGFGSLGKLVGLFTTKKDGSKNALGDQMSDAMNDTLGGIGRAIGLGNRKTDRVADASDATATNTQDIVVMGKKLPSQLASTLTSALIGAGIGGAMGGTAGSIGGALGGAAAQELFGKTLGAFAGPLGGIIGGLGGSLIGGLFKSKKQGSSTLQIGADGKAYGSDAVGKGSSAKAAAAQLSGGLAGQLNSLAETLGATLGTANVSLGYRPGHKAPAYRVDTTGRGGVKGNQVLAFESEAEAIAFALKDAIQDGVLVGLSDFAQKAVNALDIDAAVDLVGAYKNITSELDAMNDPLGASVRSLNSDLDSLVKRMTGVGASGTDLAKVEEYRAKKLNQIMEDNLSSIKDFQKSLMGDQGGVTLANQLAAAQTEYNKYRTDILAGKTVDQDKFTAAGSEVNSLASQLYGSVTQQYQSIRTDMLAVTNALIANVSNAVNGFNPGSNIASIDANRTDIADQTAVLAGYAATGNDLLGEVVALLKQGVAIGGNYSGGAESVAINGRVAMY